MKIVSLVQNLDNYILFAIKKYVQNKYLDRLMPLVISMGNLEIVWIMMAVVLILDKPYRFIGNTIILTLIISTIVGEGIEGIVKNEYGDF